MYSSRKFGFDIAALDQTSSVLEPRNDIVTNYNIDQLEDLNNTWIVIEQVFFNVI